MKTDFSWTHCKMMCAILEISSTKRFIIKDIEDLIQKRLEYPAFTINHPYFQEIFKCLISENIIQNIEIIGTQKFFKMNWKKLKVFLDEQDEMKFVDWYVTEMCKGMMLQ